MDLQEQIKAYTAWVNSQLRKRSERIDNLSEELRDGSVLISVVEIVSGQDLGGKDPKNEEEKKENVMKVLNFMKANGIKLHHVTAEEVIAGNVKTLMQLILALAAHFKPASIGGRNHNNERHHQVAASSVKHRWKNRDNSPSNVKFDVDQKLQNEMEMNLSSVRGLAETLQKLLLEETGGLPLEGACSNEDNVILQARLDQSFADKERLVKEVDKLQSERRRHNSEKSVVESRLQQHEDDLSLLRQELLHSNLDRDKLRSEKAELTVDLEETQIERNKYRSQLHKRETAISQLEDELTLIKAEHSIAMSRKDKEITHLQMQLKNATNLSDSVFTDQTTRLPRSPVLARSPNSPGIAQSPGFTKAPGSPVLGRPGEKLSRRSPVSRSHPPRRSKFQQKIVENAQTRILYFTDRDMNPAMTTVSKRVGDITLGEFKAAIKKQGNHRFVFKALDPELGTVKEEVFHDDDIIPGWEGKIVAWVEEVVRV